MKTFIILISAILIFLALIFLTSGAIAFHIVCSRKGRLVSKIISSGEDEMFKSFSKQIENGRNALKNRTKKKITIKSFDGLNLQGYYIEGENPNRTIICVHGYHGSPVHDFGGATEDLLKLANVLLIDQRAHGESEGKYITFGVLESRDCVDWAKWVCKENGAEHNIYLDGVSMGATTVLLASVGGLPSNVRGIIADCGFTSPEEILRNITQKMFKINTNILLSSIDIYCRIFAGFSLSQMHTVDAMSKNSIPILFAHGVMDNLVPHQMTQAAFDACSAPKYLVLSQKANHGMSYMVDFEKYTKAIGNLFSECEKIA